MDEQGVTRSIRLSSSLHFETLADYRAAGQGEAVLPGQTAGPLDNGYGLQGNPTLHELQDAISELEKGRFTLLYPSGMAALAALEALLKTGDQWLLPDSVYGPMRRFAEYLQEKYGVEPDYYDPTNVDSLAALINDKTKLIHIETPSSATFDITDVKAVVELAKSKNIVTSADNTWASGVLFQPLEHGVDISILSLTKYAGGYSDVFMGSVTCRDEELFRQLAYHHRVISYTVSPFSAMLVRRGLESLSVRMAAHGASALELAAAAKTNKKVVRVYQAGKQDGFEGSNGLFSLELAREYSDAELEKAFAKLKVFKIGESWGGTRSLVLPFQPAEFAKRLKPPKGTIIRFHAGLDALDKQRTDLDNFLSAC
jgi:cystathionine beta-lyase